MIRYDTANADPPVIPEDAAVEVHEDGVAPDLGPAGNELTVVEAHANAAGPTHISAGLGWATGPGPGLFYEVADTTDAADVESRVRTGLDAGRNLRDWEFTDESVRTVSIDAKPGEYASAVVVAAYGESEPIF